MTARVIRRPRPDPRALASTRMTPTQPTDPWADPTPVPTIAPSRSATNRLIVGWPTAHARNASRSPKSFRRMTSAAGATSIAVIARIEAAAIVIGRAYQGCRSAAAAVPAPSGEPAETRPSAIIARMSGLSRSDVEHVAHLARLGLTDDELGLLEGQLNHILAQYEKLAELDTEAIEPTAQ